MIDRWRMKMLEDTGSIKISSNTHNDLSAVAASRLIGAFLGLGLLLRLVRFLLRYPLWGDEAFIAVNFVHRGYLDLLRPLDHGQVSPLLFLWIERAVVDGLGFHEYALRLFPTACSLISLVVFGWLSGRVLRGAPWVLALGIFAVSTFPIRHGAEVKPYASDLLASLMLWGPAIAWWRSRREGWLWLLTGLVPLALSLSLPSVFVAGGIVLGLAVSVWATRRRGALVAFATLNVVLIASFGILYIVFIGPQRASIARDAPMMRVYWASGFPPLDSGTGTLLWLIRTHTGHLFAYPLGGDRGASVLTTIAFVTGLVALARRREGTLLAIWLAPFGLSLLGAVLRCYPYGGSTRTMLFLAPAVCWLAGIGAAELLGRLRDPRLYRHGLTTVVVALGGFGLVSLGFDVARPYRSEEDEQARAFARRFWAEQARGSELACLCRDMGVTFKPSHWQPIRTPVYLCNQEIYFRRRRLGDPIHWEAVSAARPLRCVLFDEHPIGKSSPAAWSELPGRDPALADWLARMNSRLTLRGSRTFVVNEGVCRNGIWFEDRYVVLEFTPRPAAEPVVGAATPKGLRR
jgi:hypothetical protein